MLALGQMWGPKQKKNNEKKLNMKTVGRKKFEKNAGVCIRKVSLSPNCIYFIKSNEIYCKHKENNKATITTCDELMRE